MSHIKSISKVMTFFFWHKKQPVTGTVYKIFVTEKNVAKSQWLPPPPNAHTQGQSHSSPTWQCEACPKALATDFRDNQRSSRNYIMRRCTRAKRLEIIRKNRKQRLADVMADLMTYQGQRFSTTRFESLSGINGIREREKKRGRHIE